MANNAEKVDLHAKSKYLDPFDATNAMLDAERGSHMSNSLRGHDFSASASLRDLRSNRQSISSQFNQSLPRDTANTYSKKLALEARLSNMSGISQSLEQLKSSAFSPTSQGLRMSGTHKAKDHGGGDVLAEEEGFECGSSALAQTFGVQERPSAGSRPQDTTAKSNCIDLVPFDLPRDTKDSSGDPIVKSFDVENHEVDPSAVAVELGQAAGLAAELSIPELMADLKKSLSDEVSGEQDQTFNDGKRSTIVNSESQKKLSDDAAASK